MQSFWQRCALLISIGVLIPANAAFAQATAKSNVEERTLVTEDRMELKMSYFKSSMGKESPVVIMLHGKKGTRQQWKSFATELQLKREFAVITIDLRGHGESPMKKSELKKGDYQAMAGMDLEAVRSFLLEEHQKGQLNIAKQGIVACDFSASVALVYADIDWLRTPFDDSPTPDLRTPRGQDIRALALISPDVTTPGIPATKAATSLRSFPVAVMIGASEKNGQDLTASRKLFEQISAKREKVEFLYFEKYQEDVRGMDLVQQDPHIRKNIADFLSKYVKESTVAWRDRRSRLDRD